MIELTLVVRAWWVEEDCAVVGLLSSGTGTVATMLRQDLLLSVRRKAQT